MDSAKADALWLAGGCSLPKCSHCGGYMPSGTQDLTHPPHPTEAGLLTCDETEISKNFWRRR